MVGPAIDSDNHLHLDAAFQMELALGLRITTVGSFCHYRGGEGVLSEHHGVDEDWTGTDVFLECLPHITEGGKIRPRIFRVNGLSHLPFPRRVVHLTEDGERATRSFAHLPVVTADAHLVLDAISLSRRYQLSLWDALIVQAAVKTGCTTVLTEDLQDGLEIGTLRIANPFLKTN